ncbi:hypothetical protein [Blastococcus xanthinilyticus]|uniref:Uncharacterized protein n=1 Tax=Blastococcus xanthinilyticus TaxID=1564164 RepID=A0A5S5D1F5_9ACTN|nr:hypothetical protein [Blastococcus xanthinilyticus]TYP89184.1 hypothetical protein BD833_103341 [Blastococcus xanthinilyticus]
MSKEKKKPKGGGRPPQEYGVVARFADGSWSYYFRDDRYRDDQGRPPERWGRESQATRFSSESDAQRIAGGMRTSSAVKAYHVVPLPLPEPRKSSTSATTHHAPPTQRSW